jgi:hypothetical protein
MNTKRTISLLSLLIIGLMSCVSASSQVMTSIDEVNAGIRNIYNA